MSTRSFARNLFPPLDNPKLTIRKRSRAGPTLLNNFEMATEGNGDPPVPDLQTMEELCQPSLNGRGGPIAPIAISMNFGLKNDIIQQVQNSCQFHGLSGDDANKHLDKFLHVTQSIKVNGVTDDAIRLYLFPHSLTHHATACDCTSTIGQTQNVYVAGAYNQGVERDIEVTKDTVPPTNNESTKDAQPLVVQVETLIPNSKPVVAPVIEPVVAPVSAPNPNLKPSIPYPSRLRDQKLRDKANDQKEKFFQIFHDLNFKVSFANALILMPKFGPTIKTLLTNKDKLSELARTPLNEHCSTVLLKKLPEKLGGPARTFYFPTDFVVVDFDADPRVPLILGRSFLKTERALIDVFKGELTLCVGKEAITFNLDQTSRYSANYNDMTANRIDVIDMACEEYSQEVLGFSDVIASGNPTLYYDSIVSTSSPTLTPFRDSDFLLEEVDAFLALEDDPTSPKVNHSYYDTEGDILLLEAFLNDDSSLPPPTQGNLFEKDTPFFFSKECVEAFQTLKRKLTEAPILIAPDWDLPFEPMCDASDFAIGVVLGKRHEKNFRPIHYASKTMTEAESHYHDGERNVSRDSKARFLRWVLLLQEFKFKVIDTKGAENLAVDHLSRLENPHQNVLDPKEINEAFPLETLNMVSFHGDSSTPWEDENSKYFHGIINSKRSQLFIRGILRYGDWITDPPKVKPEFLNHFSNQFLKPSSPRIKINYEFPTRLNSNQVEDLKRPISQEDIKKAVWDYGTNKSPEPDGFTFEFFSQILGNFKSRHLKDFWPISLIGSLYKIITKILATRLSLVMSDLISDVQTAFVSSRQILDGPFFLNGFLSWCKHKKINVVIFKVDFKKAFDSVRWDYLDDVLMSFGFGIKWRSWIFGCLDSSMGSVLVYGSPTPEFHFYKGLKQGDLISSFLFILVMESLHISFFRVIAFGLFKGVNINNSLTLSHLFYADECDFYRNFFNGIEKSKRKMVWIRCETILASKKNGGLGVSSFFSINRSLLFKWIWCFLSQDSSLWSRFIQAIHGVRGAIDNKNSSIKGSSWLDIVWDISSLNHKGFNLLAAAKRKLGNRENTLFWEDKWIGKVTLKTKYPRLFSLEQHKSITVAAKMGQPSLDHSFHQLPRGGSEDEQYRDLRTTTSNVLLPNMHD
nr:RNA-directed DNA polymerase, eukaryota [Tanacetum cinerariifolium]